MHEMEYTFHLYLLYKNEFLKNKKSVDKKNNIHYFLKTKYLYPIKLKIIEIITAETTALFAATPEEKEKVVNKKFTP